MAARRAWLAATIVGIAAFALYRATLLPGFDFGDTGFFQATVGDLTLTPRNAYPLYFAIGNVFLWLSHAGPAHALNLASAVEGAIACGVIVILAAELSESLLAGIAAALLFAVSYTFWSQAIIAEVYSLHILFVSLTLLLLLRWEARPTLARLACFFAVFALGFGNHLSMSLLLPAYAVFLLVAAPDGWRTMLRPRVVLLAAAIAIAGASQYLWNLRGLWQWPHPAPGIVEALGTFWLDVTKSDWRETLVMQVPSSLRWHRLAAYQFDLLQQFGWAIALAPLGLGRLFVTNWRRALLLLLAYAVNAGFAFSYSVGDTHVFYLPSHLILVLLFAPGLVAIESAVRKARQWASSQDPERQRRQRAGVGPRENQRISAAMCALALAYAAVRGYHDFPALDRSDDRRPETVMAQITSGVDGSHGILLADFDWELIDGFAYFTKVVRPSVPFAWVWEVLPYAPKLVQDNHDIGRQVWVTAAAADRLSRAYGGRVPINRADPSEASTIRSMTSGLPPGTRYVLCVLKPTRDHAIARDDVSALLDALTAPSKLGPYTDGEYQAFAGLVGQPPALVVGSDTPFTRSVQLDGVRVEIRMESWLEFDTIRRMGFGQVIAARHHTLIVERGVSFAAFGADGRAIRTGYAANIFAPQPRFFIPPKPPV